MCGINGIIGHNSELKKKISTMNLLLKHRGPDDEGFVCINSQDGLINQFSGDDSIEYIKNTHKHITAADFVKYDLVFGARRLSIIDLSEKGHIPMSDSTGKIWITYNGEVYNYIELREELRSFGYKFNTECDTEVIIYSYLHWGEECLNHFNGMWAFAIWDGFKNKLFLARDRFGIKPLYYSLINSSFAFSSEIKPLIILKPGLFEVDEARIPFFVLYGNRLNTDNTYIKDIYSLKPSHYLVYQNEEIFVKKYYEIPIIPYFEKTEDQLKDKIIEILTDSVKLRFRSDVPVGTCLSGGFDSSGIVSLSSQMNVIGLNTFSAVWKDKECDESNYIDIINREFGCYENKIEPLAEEFEDVFEKLSYYQEIPTEGPGLIPQWYVMKKAKSKVKVLLDGQGGDEVFGGYYGTWTFLLSIMKEKKIMSFFSNLKLFFNFLNKNDLHHLSSYLFPYLYNKVVRGYLSNNFNILNKDILSKTPKHELYYDAAPPKLFKHYINNFSYHYIRTLTIPSLLHYEDRASMAHSIESRVPFLDYRLVQLGINLHPHHLIYKKVSRPLYRKALENNLPAEIINRKIKLGFPTPFAKWTRKTLKPMVTDILLSKKSKIYEYLNMDFVKQKLDSHFEEKIDFSWFIWRLLSLEKFLSIVNTIKSKSL